MVYQVLVVEDDNTLSEMIQYNFQRQGYDVLLAGDVRSTASLVTCNSTDRRIDCRLASAKAWTEEHNRVAIAGVERDMEDHARPEGRTGTISRFTHLTFFLLSRPASLRPNCSRQWTDMSWPKVN